MAIKLNNYLGTTAFGGPSAPEPQFMRHFLAFILTVFFSPAFGQDFSYPLIHSTGQSITDFVPAGWTILDSTEGDLNKDRVKDAAIVIQHKDRISLTNSLGDTVLTQPRMLLIF